MTQPERKVKWPRWSRVLLWAAVLAVAGAIFVFSSQSGEESMETSGPLVEAAMAVVKPDYHTLSAGEQAGLYDALCYLVRKAAHFTEFAALGFLLRLLLESYAVQRHCSSRGLLLGAGYAATDELHQLIGGTRTAMWQDVVLDSCGVLAGITLAYALLVLYTRYGPGAHQKSPE